jgi:hypothetical protein
MLWYQLVVIGNGLEDCAEGGNVWIEGNFVATPPGPSDSQTDQSQFSAAVQPPLVFYGFLCHSRPPTYIGREALFTNGLNVPHGYECLRRPNS